MDNFKERFFANYWGQKVLSVSNTVMTVCCGELQQDNGKYLLLTPISKITDEHAIEVANQFEATAFGIHTRATILKFSFMYGDNVNDVEIDLLADGRSIDFLRSKGYALPYQEKTVEELIEMGYLKLR